MTNGLEPQFPGEFIMAGGVSVSEATMQFFVEAMRANTNVLENVNKSMQLQQEELKAQLGLITDVRERVIRIEALPRMHKEISELRGKILLLEMAGVQAKAKADTWNWIVKYVPTLAGVVVTIIASVLIILVTSGQLEVRPPDRSSETATRQAPPQ